MLPTYVLCDGSDILTANIEAWGHLHKNPQIPKTTLDQKHQMFKTQALALLPPQNSSTLQVGIFFIGKHFKTK